MPSELTCMKRFCYSISCGENTFQSFSSEERNSRKRSFQSSPNKTRPKSLDLGYSIPDSDSEYERIWTCHAWTSPESGHFGLEHSRARVAWHMKRIHKINITRNYWTSPGVRAQNSASSCEFSLLRWDESNKYTLQCQNAFLADEHEIHANTVLSECKQSGK